MALLGRKLRTIEGPEKALWLGYWCPGCDGVHALPISKPNPANGAQWAFDGNLEAPSFHPSVHVKGHCHSWVKNGTIEFLSDCDHALTGKTVPLPDWPPDLSGW